MICYNIILVLLYYVVPSLSAASSRSELRASAWPALITDGIGPPDPNPRNLVNWCLYYDLVNPAFFYTGCLGL